MSGYSFCIDCCFWVKEANTAHIHENGDGNRLDGKKREKGERKKSGQIKPVDVRDLKAVYFEIDETEQTNHKKKSRHVILGDYPSDSIRVFQRIRREKKIKHREFESECNRNRWLYASFMSVLE